MNWAASEPGPSKAGSRGSHPGRSGDQGRWAGLHPHPRPCPAAPALGLPPGFSLRVASEQGLGFELHPPQLNWPHLWSPGTARGHPRALGALATPRRHSNSLFPPLLQAPAPLTCRALCLSQLQATTYAENTQCARGAHRLPEETGTPAEGWAVTGRRWALSRCGQAPIQPLPWPGGGQSQPSPGALRPLFLFLSGHDLGAQSGVLEGEGTDTPGRRVCLRPEYPDP